MNHMKLFLKCMAVVITLYFVLPCQAVKCQAEESYANVYYLNNEGEPPYYMLLVSYCYNFWEIPAFDCMEGANMLVDYAVSQGAISGYWVSDRSAPGGHEAKIKFVDENGNTVEKYYNGSPYTNLPSDYNLQFMFHFSSN